MKTRRFSLCLGLIKHSYVGRRVSVLYVQCVNEIIMFNRSATLHMGLTYLEIVLIKQRNYASRLTCGVDVRTCFETDFWEPRFDASVPLFRVSVRDLECSCCRKT